MLLDLVLDLTVLLGIGAWLTLFVLREAGRLGVRRGDGLAYARRRWPAVTDLPCIAAPDAVPGVPRQRDPNAPARVQPDLTTRTR